MSTIHRSIECEISKVSHYAPELEEVLHVYPKGYAGITAAAMNLPGYKIAVPQDWSNEVPVISEFDGMGSCRKLVVHGMSLGLYNFVLRLIFRFPDVRLFLVWHGNLAQLAATEEQSLYLLFCELRKQKSFVHSTSMRFDQSELLPKAWGGHLLNLPPNFNFEKNLVKNNNALCPSWNDLRKNLIFNLYLGANNQSISEVHHYQPIFSAKRILDKKNVKEIAYRDAISHLSRLPKYELILNVTLIDCQPMVDLEALASGAKLLCSEHAPIKEIFPHEIFDLILANPFDMQKAEKKLDRLMTVNSQEWKEVSENYITGYTAYALLSWKEFLD